MDDKINIELDEQIKKHIKKKLKEEFKLQNESTKKYNGWLVSNSLIKRSLAIFGHYFIAYFILIIPIIIITIIFISISGYKDVSKMAEEKYNFEQHPDDGFIVQ